MTTLRCSACGETDPARFSRNKSKRTGKQSKCKACTPGRAASKIVVEDAATRAMEYIERKGKQNER